MIFVQDDLLYYLQVARNIANGHGSTFNGLVPTNGYQPLWLLLLIPLAKAVDLVAHPRAILAFLAATNYIAALATFFFARHLLRTSRVRPLLVFALASWITLYSVTLFFYGMEVTLTVPIVLGLLCLLRNISWLEHSAIHTFLVGLLLSAMVLSRIDTLIFGALLLAGIILSPPLRRLLRPDLLLGAALGLLPIVIYFLVNHTFFHTWLPVSGMAKELKLNHRPSLEPWRVFFHLLAATVTLILLSAAGLLPAVRSRLTPIERVLYPAVLVFPFLYYLVLSCVSDWTLWGWYMYPLRAAICISLLIYCLWPPLSRVLQQDAVTGFLLLTVFVALGLLRWTHQQTDITAASLQIQQFATNHPGTYAMGDRAGRVAWLIHDPVVQTEGLMMDRPYLDHVRRQEPLRDVLADYGVDYYVATAYKPFTGCFQASEPAKAGPESAHMRAQFCGAPAATFIHDGIQTLIFDVKKKQ